MRQFYPVQIRVDGQVHWLVWFGDEIDGVVCDGQRLRSFASLSELQAYASHQALNLLGDVSIFDLDAAMSWSGDPDPSEVLDAWNLFKDIASSLGSPFFDRGPESDALYEKVFRANNLPAMTVPGERFTPIWDETELTRLRNLLMAGVEMIRTAL